MSYNSMCPVDNSSGYCRRNVPLGIEESQRVPDHFLKICGASICNTSAVSGSEDMSSQTLILAQMKKKLEECRQSGDSDSIKMMKQLQSFIDRQERIIAQQEAKMSQKQTMSRKIATFSRAPVFVNGQLRK